ncbi:DTW domain-containing protein 1 [Dufourea novaeangliae]|uniref:tRNA-uridine aminocarboxypropyltransferase 1 n=1 Tax=Dufourea novaeangliae TaxID=178035 RepID=A0A154PC77_DUFNO|nr:DTW domain-containing protein 1 [Dufourea novaeangliae]
MAKSDMINDYAEKLSKLEREQSIIDRAPFRHLKITDAQILDSIEGREICGRCYKSRKFFCYLCCLPVINEKYFPKVKLPIKIDIVKHAREIDGKSTAIHAAVLAPNDVRIFIYPDFPEIVDKEETVLIFPSQTGKTIESLFKKEIKQGDTVIINRIQNEFPIKRAIFIDSTWHQTKAIYKDHRFRDLQCVILKSRISQFWRHQKKSPRWYLATVEAIHQFLVELHTYQRYKVFNHNRQDRELHYHKTGLHKQACKLVNFNVASSILRKRWFSNRGG